MLPSWFTKRANSYQTTTVHTADSVNKMRKSRLESNHTSKAKIMLARW
jgi:hypothetical protein